MKEENKENITTEEVKSETSENKEDKYIKTLVQFDENLWTYGSPVIFTEGAFYRNTAKGDNYVILNFTNIDERVIKDVIVKVTAIDGEEEVYGERKFLALNQKPMEERGSDKRIKIKNKDAKTFKILVETVRFDNGEVWTKKKAEYESVGSIEDLEEFSAEKLKEYKDIYYMGIDSIESDDSTSIEEGVDVLKGISWYKNTSELIKHGKKKAELARRNEERKQAGKSNKVKREEAIKKRYKVMAISACAIVVIAILAVILYIIPSGKYETAKKDLKAQKYDKAVKEFSSLHGFMKSEDYLAEAYYNLGEKQLTANKDDAALDLFKKAYDADKTSDYGKMAGAYVNYYKGNDLFDKKDYEQALKYYTSSADAASDFTLINKASVGMAKVYYINKNYESSWKTIKNVFAKDKTYKNEYGAYGYYYAKQLVDAGKIAEGMVIYNQVSQYTKLANLNQSVYNQAIKLAEQGKMSDSMSLLNKIKSGYKPAANLYKNMSSFNKTAKSWVGTWSHRGKVNGVKKTYKIYISQLLYKGDLCLKIKDLNNKTLGFETVISKKNRVTQITVGSYMLHFKLKKYQDQKFTYSKTEANKMVRTWKYDGNKYKTKFKRK